MLPTLCGIISAPQQHSSILVDGAVELITLALAPSGPQAAAQIHAAATPAMLQVGGRGMLGVARCWVSRVQSAAQQPLDGLPAARACSRPPSHPRITSHPCYQP